MDLLIFDLDGTLIDSKRDLANSVNAALAALGRKPLENDLIYSYVGNGAPVLMRRAMGDDAGDEEVRRALECFLAYYREHMLDYTYLYPGVKESLDRLLAAKVKMAVLTNKPVRFSRDLVRGLGVDGHFFQVYGGNSFEQKKPHPIGVEKLMEESGVPRERTLMVGDSAIDVITARNARIGVCGVTYGFQPEGFCEAPPDFLVDSMEELAEIVISARNGS